MVCLVPLSPVIVFTLYVVSLSAVCANLSSVVSPMPITDVLPGEGPQLSELSGLLVVKPESVQVATGLAK